MEVAVHNISGRLAKRGHEIIVYCWANEAQSQQPLPKNIRLIYIPTLRTKHLGAFIHTLLSSLHVLFIKADIVNFQALGPSFFSFLPKLFGKKTVVTIHSLDWKRKKWNTYARFFLRICEFMAIFSPDRAITVSLTLKKYYESRFRKEISYIPNAVDIPEISSGQYSMDRNIILFTGRLVPEKGIDCLIKAYNDIKPDMDLIIAGESWPNPGYASYLFSISAGNNRVKFLGQVSLSELDDLYRSAYIFVLPSEIEGAPLSLLEAMSYGVCPVTANIPECEEISGESALYFRSGDYNDLKEKIRFLIEYPAFTAGKGLMARKIAAERYGWEYVIDGLEGLYFSVKKQ